MSAPISGGDVISDVVGSVGKVVSPLTASLQQWINAAVESVGTVASNVGPFVPPPFAMLLFTILFVHFVATALEANTQIAKVWPIFSVSMHELKIQLQQRVLGGNTGLVYWGSFVLGASVGASSRSYSVDAYMAMYAAMGLVFIWALNQASMTMTMTRNESVNYGSTPDVGSSDYTQTNIDFDGKLVLGGDGFPQRKALLSLTKGKPFFIVVSWLQAVTDLVIANSIPGMIYGYGLGKLVSFTS